MLEWCFITMVNISIAKVKGGKLCSNSLSWVWLDLRKQNPKIQQNDNKMMCNFNNSHRHPNLMVLLSQNPSLMGKLLGSPC